MTDTTAEADVQLDAQTGAPLDDGYEFVPNTAEDLAASQELVRVEEANGARVSVSRAHAEAVGLTVLDGVSAYHPTSGRVLGPAFEGDPDYAPELDGVEETSVDDLKGAALDEALTKAGLPTSGKVAEKRKALAEHLAAAQDPGTTV